MVKTTKVTVARRNGGGSGVLRSAIGATALSVVAALIPAAAEAVPPPSTDVAASARPAPVVTGFKGADTAAKKAAAQAGAGGGSTSDFTGDGWQDILARGASDGVLKLYGHSGSYSGTTSTYNSVTAINFGWGGFRFVGQGNVNGDQFADVLSIDNGGVLRVYPHSGTFSGTATLSASVVAGYGWNINDRIYIADFTGDGLADVVAKRAGTDQLFYYPNLGGLNGTSTFGAPVSFCSQNCGDVRALWTADITGDRIEDLTLVFDDGQMLMADGARQVPAEVLGYGWNTLSALAETDVNKDGLADILARRNDGTLIVYPNKATYTPNDPLATFNPPATVGYGWEINDVIT